jgi:hypothetical protein
LIPGLQLSGSRSHFKSARRWADGRPAAEAGGRNSEGGLLGAATRKRGRFSNRARTTGSPVDARSPSSTARASRSAKACSPASLLAARDSATPAFVGTARHPALDGKTPRRPTWLGERIDVVMQQCSDDIRGRRLLERVTWVGHVDLHVAGYRPPEHSSVDPNTAYRPGSLTPGELVRGGAPRSPDRSTHPGSANSPRTPHRHRHCSTPSPAGSRSDASGIPGRRRSRGRVPRLTTAQLHHRSRAGRRRRAQADLSLDAPLNVLVEWVVTHGCPSELGGGGLWARDEFTGQWLLP